MQELQDVDEYHAAMTLAKSMIDRLEEQHASILKASPELQAAAFEAYTAAGNAFHDGRLEDSVYALDLFAKALALQPNNEEAELNYDDLAISLGFCEVKCDPQTGELLEVHLKKPAKHVEVSF